MTATDDFLANNAEYASTFNGPLPLPPAKHVAVVACMDARLDVYRILGLNEGEANVIRNAGGVVTDDAIRSLAISQRLLGTEEIILIHHTDCGMLTFTDDDFRSSIEQDTGIKPEWTAEAFSDLDGALEPAVDAIVFEEECQVLGVRQVIDRHDLEVFRSRRHGPKDQATNPTKPVDPDSNRHACHLLAEDLET